MSSSKVVSIISCMLLLAAQIEGSIVAKWLFTGTTADTSGNGYVLTADNIRFTTDLWSGGKVAQSNGNGNGNGNGFGASSCLYPTAQPAAVRLQSETILSMWVKPSYSYSTEQTLACWSGTAGNTETHVSFVIINNELRLKTNYIPNIVKVTDLSGWSHFLLVINPSTSNIIVEVNGVRKGNYNYNLNSFNPTAFSIGCKRTSTSWAQDNSLSIQSGTALYGVTMQTGPYPCSVGALYDGNCHFTTSTPTAYDPSQCSVMRATAHPYSIQNVLDDIFANRHDPTSTAWSGLKAPMAGTRAWEWEDPAPFGYSSVWCGDANHLSYDWWDAGSACQTATKPSSVTSNLCTKFDYQSGPGLFDVDCSEFHVHLCTYDPIETAAPSTPFPDTLVPSTPFPDTDAPNTTAPATPFPDTDAPPTLAPDTGAPATPFPDTNAPDTTAPVTPFPDTASPATSVPPTNAPNTDAPATPFPDTLAPPTPFPDTNAPDTSSPATPFPDTSAPLTPFPATTAPATPFPDTVAPQTPFPDTDAPPTAAPATPFPNTDAPATPFPGTVSPPTPAPDTLPPSTLVPGTTAAPPTPFPDTAIPTNAPATPFPDTNAPLTAAPATPFPDTAAPQTPSPATTAPATPFPDTDAPATPFPGTVSPPTPAPDTLSPATLVPGTTAAPPTPFPDTAIPTDAPATPFPDTNAPFTAAPATVAPATPFPDTNSPPTTAPLTPFPDTSSPATTAPTTPFPDTVVPLTVAPPTPFPDTATPDTKVPDTSAPATPFPKTAVPATFPPVTSAPATPFPDTQAPTTTPPTQAPSTAVPGTFSPLTQQPVTAVPTTVPVTSPPTQAPKEEAVLTPPTPSPGKVIPASEKSLVAGGATGAAVAAGTGGGKLAIVSGMNCEVEDIDLGGGEPLDWEFHPLGIGIGDHAQKYFLGAVVSNLGIVVVFLILNYAIAWVQVAFLQVPLSTAIFYVRAPGLGYIPMMWLLTGTSMAASNLTFFPSRAPAWVSTIGAAVLALCVAFPIVMWFSLLRRGKFQATTVPDPKINEDAAEVVKGFGTADGADETGKMEAGTVYTGWKRTAYILVFGSEVWVRKDGASEYFVERYGLFFEQYRHNFHWFSLVEMVQILALSLSSAWKPRTHGMCMFRNVSITIVLFFYFLAIVTLRPYNSTLDMVTGTILSGLMFVAVLLMAIAIGVGGSAVMMKWAAHLLFFTALVMMFKGAYDLILYCLDVKIGRRWDAVRAARAGNVEKWKAQQPTITELCELSKASWSVDGDQTPGERGGTPDMDVHASTVVLSSRELKNTTTGEDMSRMDMQPLLSLLGRPCMDVEQPVATENKFRNLKRSLTSPVTTRQGRKYATLISM